MNRTLDTWWSPAAQCWRIEDGEMLTYYDLEHVIGHLRECGAGAVVSPPPHTGRTAQLVTALQEAGVPVVYSAH